MALRIVDEQGFPTLGTDPEILTARSAPQAPMAPTQGMGRRYEDIVPFTGNNFIGNLFNPSGSDARENYARKAMQFNQQVDDQARKDAMVELNIMKVIEATPPGKRDAQMKVLTKWYQSRGKPFDPEIQKFYKNADEMDFKAHKWAVEQVKQANPNLNADELWNAFNTDPALQVEVYGKMEQFKEQQAKTEGQTLKNKRSQNMFEQMQRMQQEEATGAPTSPAEPIAPMVAPPTLPQASVTPGGSQGASGWSKERTIAQIQAEAKRQKVDPNLMVAVALQESSLVPNVPGDGGKSIGFFQLQPAAAQDVGMTPEQRFDPVLNIRGGVAYFKQKLDQSDGNVQQALLRYNGGGDPQYVQNVQKQLSTLPSYQRESTDDAPPKAQAAITALDRKIQQSMKKAEMLSTMAGEPEFDRMHDNEMKKVEVLQKERERVEAKVTPKFRAEFEEYVGQRTGQNPVSVDPIKRSQLFYEFQGEQVALGARKAAAESQATLADRLSLAQAGNLGNIPGPDTVLKLRNTTGKGSLRPTGLTQAQIASQNAETEAATGQPKWVMEKPLEPKTEDEMNTKLSAVESAQRVMEYLDDKGIAGYVGTLLSNPEGGFAKAVADIWGGTVPEKYREAAAEIANLTSTILSDRIGAAQTAAEFKRLSPLIKDMNAVDATTLKASMRIVHNSMAIDFNRRYRGLVGRGYEVLPDWKEVKPIETATQREQREADTKSTPPSPTVSNPLLDAARKDRERKGAK